MEDSSCEAQANGYADEAKFRAQLSLALRAHACPDAQHRLVSSSVHASACSLCLATPVQCSLVVLYNLLASAKFGAQLSLALCAHAGSDAQHRLVRFCCDLWACLASDLFRWAPVMVSLTAHPGSALHLC